MAVAATSGDPETKVAFIFSFLITLTALMLTFFLLRIYARLTVIGVFGIEDWLVAAAVLGILVETIDGCVSTKYGAGYHYYDFKPSWVVPYAKTSYISGAVFPICVAFPKLALCVMYLRIFPSKGNRNFSIAAIVYLISWLISTNIVMLFPCRPVAAAWNPTILGAKCIKTRQFYLASGALNSLSDFLVYLWPARTLWHIQVPLKRRLGLIMVFTSGLIVCVTAVIRLVFLEKVFTSPDFAYNGAVIWVTTSVEMNVGIICSCLHAVKPLLKIWFPRAFGSSNDQTAAYPSKSRGYGVTGQRSFPFQSLGGGSDAEARVKMPPVARTKGDPFSDTRLSATGSLEDVKDYDGVSGPGNRSRAEAWAGGTEGVSTPTHGIAYTKSVTIDSRAIGKEDDVDVETRSRGGLNAGSKVLGKDNDSEEWIMNDQGRRE